MLPTIIFFLAMIFSFATVTNIICDLAEDVRTYKVPLFGVIAIILWSYLFYLLH